VPRNARLPARSRLAFDTQYAVKIDVQTSNESAVHQLLSSTLPSPTATAKNRPVRPILGFVMNGDFVVLAALLNKTGTSSVTTKAASQKTHSLVSGSSKRREISAAIQIARGTSTINCRKGQRPTFRTDTTIMCGV
jgi:hypothetical protein